MSEYQEADLDVLDLFDADTLDVLAFTSYPFAVQGINMVTDLPDDYYSRALDPIAAPDIPFAFTEVAWSTLAPFGGEREAGLRGLKKFVVIGLMSWVWAEVQWEMFFEMYAVK
ncbi:MAG: hypothetical protein ABIK28_02650 [Planctomycetota bacterium]